MAFTIFPYWSSPVYRDVWKREHEPYSAKACQFCVNHPIAIQMAKNRSKRSLRVFLAAVGALFSLVFFVVALKLHTFVVVAEKSSKVTSLARVPPPRSLESNDSGIPHGEGSKVQRSKKWDPQKLLEREPPIKLKINFPIFIASLPKSGTTSIWQYFNCGGVRSSHQWIKVNDTASERSGKCIQRNVAINRPPFAGCGAYNAYADTGFVTINKKSLKAECYYPSVDALNAMHTHYPNATFVHAIRETESWYSSISKWGDGSLLKRWRRCNATGFPGKTLEPAKIKAFYRWHTANIRQFAKEHPSLNYIEVLLESESTGSQLQQATGIPSSCWGKCSPGSKFCVSVSS